MLRKMLFSAYANILEVQDDYVLVQSCVCSGGMPFVTKARLIYPTTSQVQAVFRPEKGDKVLLIGLQSYSPKMFETESILTENEENDVQHYTILGCVAIPLNIENSEVPLRISDGDFKAGTKDVHGITINEGDDPVVRWSELNTALQGLISKLNNHCHGGVQTGSGVSGPPKAPSETPTPSTEFSLDISNAASEVLAVPKKETT